MATLSTHTNWQSQDRIEHWLKHGVIPVLLIMILLMFPNPWTLEGIDLIQSLQIELVESTQHEQIIDKKEDPVVKQTETIEPPEEVPEELAETIPANHTQAEPATKVPSPPQSNPSEQPKAIESRVNEPQPPTTAELMMQLQNSPSMEITPEFKARTGPAKTFFENKPVVTDWYADLPYLDESVDRPQLQMRFYAEGIEGSIERFFDKITVSKTFTTKYGTKIHCAWIGVIVSCAWQ